MEFEKWKYSGVGSELQRLRRVSFKLKKTRVAFLKHGPFNGTTSGKI
jgi:hypothetical protein